MKTPWDWRNPPPPIDWAALAEERRQRWSKMPLDRLAKLKAGRERWLKRKRAAATAKVMEAARAARVNRTKLHYHHMPPGTRIEDRMAAAMKRGGWYSSRDLAGMAGCPYGSAKMIVHRMMRKGTLVRAENEAWDPTATGVERFAGGPVEPRWLYGLGPNADATKP